MSAFNAAISAQSVQRVTLTCPLLSQNLASPLPYFIDEVLLVEARSEFDATMHAKSVDGVDTPPRSSHKPGVASPCVYCIFRRYKVAGVANPEDPSHPIPQQRPP